MASSLPGSGPLSAGTKAGADRSINLLKNDVITPAAFNSRLSLKGISDTLAAAKSESFSVPQMVVGPPYKYSELYGVGTSKNVQIIEMSVTIDGSDYYKWSPGVKGTPLSTPVTLLDFSVGKYKIENKLTNVYRFFKDKPKFIYVQLSYAFTVYRQVMINGAVMTNGNQFIYISPENNGTFSYTVELGYTGFMGSTGQGTGTMKVTLLDQITPNGELYITHRNWQRASKPSGTSKTYVNGILQNSYTFSKLNNVGASNLNFPIINASRASLEWAGRGTGKITEQPTASNNYSTTVLFDDDPQGAAGNYTMTLTLVM